MNEPLSIFAAAADAGAATALRIAGREYTFTELADLVRARLATLAPVSGNGRSHPLVADGSLATLVTMYALLEARVPALLLHARLTDTERSALLADADRAGAVPHADAAAILYTSGTTGEPRAAVLTRSALVASAAASAANLGWQPDDCWLLCMPLAHVGGLSIVTRCLAARRATAVEPHFDAGRFPEWISAHRITLASLVPTMLARVLDAHPDWRWPPSLRAVLLGGAPASSALLRRAGERGIPLLPCYGLTETCAQVTAARYETRFSPADRGVGPPLPGADVRIVEGHIEVRGPMLMAGYWNAPSLRPGAWFDTGDVGTLDAAGNLHVRARRTDLIVTGGENVYPAEVERALESFPGIAAAGVFGVPDEAWGQTVAAALVANGAEPDDAALQEYFGARLAPHKRPRRICFVPRLPQTAGGKLDRRSLAGFTLALRPLGKPPAAA
ncbi:MAG: AMP-binding protein [Betaproteobacteria bacterium]